jgi:hypothetical protein
MKGYLPNNTQHSKQADIHAQAGFELTIPASERPQTYASDRAATGTVHAVKAIPLKAMTGPDGYRRLKLLDFKTIST